MVTTEIHITSSKILAYLIMILGTIYAFVFKDSNVIIASFSAASAVIIGKTYTASKIKQKQIEHPEPKQTDDGPDI